MVSMYIIGFWTWIVLDAFQRGWMKTPLGALIAIVGGFGVAMVPLLWTLFYWERFMVKK